MATAYPSITTIEEEVWKPIPGFQGKYSVSNLGNIRCENHLRPSEFGRIMRPFLTDSGYARINLSGPNGRRHFFVHRLVALAFIGEPPEGHVINHIDHNPLNNRLSNIEYVTQRENIHKSIDAGRWDHVDRSRPRVSGDAHPLRRRPELVRRGEKSTSAKLTAEQVKEIRAKHANQHIGARRLAKEYGVSPSAIKFILARRNWAHLD
jgi:hypothetical protein